MILQKKFNLKKCRLPLAVSIILVFTLNKVNAQQDYIITLNNDTLKGTIKSGLLSKYVFEGITGEKDNLSPNRVNGYYIADKQQKYTVKAIPGREKRSFFLVLEEGKISLYQLDVKTPEGVWIVTWYASKQGGEWKDIITDQLFSKVKPREIIFKDLIADNENLSSSYPEEKKYNFAIKRKYIQAYNSQ